MWAGAGLLASATDKDPVRARTRPLSVRECTLALRHREASPRESTRGALANGRLTATHSAPVVSGGGAPQAIHLANLATEDHIPLAIPGGWHVSCLQYSATAGALQEGADPRRSVSRARGGVCSLRPADPRSAAALRRACPLSPLGALAAGMLEGKAIIWTKTEQSAGAAKPAPLAPPLGVLRKASRAGSRALVAGAQAAQQAASTAHLDDTWDPSPDAHICCAPPEITYRLVPSGAIPAPPSDAAVQPRAAAPVSLIALGPPVNGSACLGAIGQGLPYVLFKHRLQCRARTPARLSAPHVPSDPFPSPTTPTRL